MKYTFQIKFGSSDYVSLTPNTDIILNGEWIPDTMIWRESISEMKITRAENPTVYDLLESWFEDSTKFTTQIFIKILKSAAQDSVHWFGIKWGKLNKELKTYIVEPIPNDLWGQYFENNIDVQNSVNLTASDVAYWYDTTSPFAYDNIISTRHTSLKKVCYDLVLNATTWPTSDIVSSFLWQDNYEDTSAVAEYNGQPGDYVTEKQSFLSRAGMIVNSGHSIKDFMSWMNLCRVMLFFDSNNKLRFEHVKFFNDKLTDNAVNFSSYLHDYDEEYNYDNYNIPTLETLSMKTVEEDTDPDFQNQNIIYSRIRNRPDIQKIDHSFQLFSNLGYIDAEPTDDLTIWSGVANQVHTLINNDVGTFSSDENTFDASFGAGPPDEWFKSNDFRVTSGDTYDFECYLTTLSGELTAKLVNGTSMLTISNTITISSTGSTQGVFTLTGTANNCHLRITQTSGPGNAIGYVTVDSASKVMIPPRTGVISSDVIINGEMSIGNIFANWWQDDRYNHTAKFNDVWYNFNGTVYNLRRKTVKFHYSGVINPLYGFNDGTRIGRIEKWKRSLDTDFYEIDVIYQEDE